MKENEIFDLFKLAILIIPPVTGATVWLINRTNKSMENKRAIAFKTLEENSLGESLAKEIKAEFEHARKERKAMEERLDDIEESNRKHRIENQDAIHRFGHQNINDISELLSEIRKLKNER